MAQQLSINLIADVIGQKMICYIWLLQYHMPKNSITHAFDGLPLWEHFLTKTANEPVNQKMVKDHIDYALPLLDHFIAAFPKYTLHNHRHQQNIIKLMGELLGDRLHDLSGLEAAILILSAVYHDIGMVFKPEQLESAANEAEFKTFLDKNPKARLQYEEANKIADKEIIEWYCRWMHGKRVWIYLNEVHDTIPFHWNDMHFKNELGEVSQSHTEYIDYIKNFDTHFLGECDLLFCALLLRLSDIMDFDNSRTPKSVYEFLELDKAKKGTDSVSKNEWQKHLSSNGFKFSIQNGKSVLRFLATPKSPKVEISIKEFLTIIEKELNASSKLMKSCSDRWKSIELPAEINKDDIRSDNYKSGNYHFSLSEDKVMTLLTGEGLYNDQYIFLRELLQNAIDTSRHREFRERANNPHYKAEAIEVSFFNDSEGYQWVRIDDYGMGMNQEIIDNHLLKKGDSYYNSYKFKLEKLEIQKKADTDFVPISRFGIGLLSCFIIGDRIEISTKYFNEPDNAYRLSLEGRNGFFTIQTKKDHHIPSPMPSKYPENSGFRSEVGTSIAVRITTNKELAGFNMQSELENYLLAPPIPIKFEGNQLGGDFDELLNKPWVEESSFQLSDNFVKKVETITGLSFPKGIKINTNHVNISTDSLTPKLKGQIVIISIDTNGEIWTNTEEGKKYLELELQNNKLTIKCTYLYEEGDSKTNNYTTEDISHVLEAIRIPSKMYIQANSRYYYDKNSFFSKGILLSHNGINLIDKDSIFSLNKRRISQLEDIFFSSYHISSLFYTGIIYFQDELLPDLTVSRNEIRGLSFGIIANVETSVRSLRKLIWDTSNLNEFYFFHLFNRYLEITNNIISSSCFYQKNQAFWDNCILLSTKNGEMSISQLRSTKIEDISCYIADYSNNFYDQLRNYVIEYNFNVSVSFKAKHSLFADSEFYLHFPKTTLPDCTNNFPPLTFVPFNNHAYLLVLNNKVNIHHPFTKWYIKAYAFLDGDYYYYSQQLIYGLMSTSYSSPKPKIEQINNILEKLRLVLPTELRPPIEITLINKDFEFIEDSEQS